MPPPREESGVSEAEVALPQQLVVPGQLPPPSERPGGMEGPPAPPVVIPPTRLSYAQAATSSPLDGADWVYVARGRAAKPMADKYSGPFKVLVQGNKVWKVQVCGKVEIISRDHLKPHLGSVAPKGCSAAQTWEAQDSLSLFSGFSFFSREARGACVTDEFYSNKAASRFMYCNNPPTA